MGRWDFKTTPGWHWESIKPGGQARFRVKDSWIEETPAAKYPGLALLAGGEMSTGRSFSDPSSDHYLYIAESRMSRDRAHSKIIDKLSTAIGYDNAVHLFSIAPSGYSAIGREIRSGGIDSTIFNFILSKDWHFSRMMSDGGQSLAQKLDKALYFDSESWNFHTLAINDEVVTYSFYLGPGTTQEMNVFSQFWGTDSNTGCNYFFNSIEV